MSAHVARWRLILDSYERGAHNMAIDEALLVHAAADSAIPALRCYQWSPPCLSLGRFQSTAGLDADQLTALGLDIVRRPTGGRAILHAEEVTYAVILPPTHPLARRSVRESYWEIARALEQALQTLGCAPAIAPARTRGDEAAQQRVRTVGRPDCFAIASDYEIVADGRKLIGSAQVRRDGAILQHGSILTGPYRSPDPLFGRPAPTVMPADLGTILHRPVSRDEIVAALVSGFRQAFSIDLEPDVLSAAEARLALELESTKYSSRDWTFAR